MPVAVRKTVHSRSNSKGSFTPDPAWCNDDERHRGAAVQCNAYGKFQCESGDGGAVTYRGKAVPLGAARRRDTPDVKEH